MDRAELIARREALGLSQAALAQALGNAENTIRQWERGKSRIPDRIGGELAGLEGIVEDLADEMTDVIESGVSGVLLVHLDDAAFWSARPDSDGTPAALQRVAAARVQTELRSQGRAVDIVQAPPARGDLP